MWMYGTELQVPYVKGGGSGGRRLGEEMEVAGDTAISGSRVRGKGFTTSSQMAQVLPTVSMSLSLVVIAIMSRWRVRLLEYSI